MPFLFFSLWALESIWFSLFSLPLPQHTLKQLRLVDWFTNSNLTKWTRMCTTGCLIDIQVENEEELKGRDGNNYRGRYNNNSCHIGFGSNWWWCIWERRLEPLIWSKIYIIINKMSVIDFLDLPTSGISEVLSYVLSRSNLYIQYCSMYYPVLFNQSIPSL